MRVRVKIFFTFSIFCDIFCSWGGAAPLPLVIVPFPSKTANNSIPLPCIVYGIIFDRNEETLIQITQKSAKGQSVEKHVVAWEKHAI